MGCPCGHVCGSPSAVDEPLFDAVRDGVFEHARLSVDFVPRHAEHVGEQAFRQPVAPHDADRDLETLARQLDVAAHLVLHETVVDELLEHPRDRGRRDAQLGRERGRRDARALTLEAIDRLHIHLERLGEVRVRVTRHSCFNFAACRGVPRRRRPAARASPASLRPPAKRGVDRVANVIAPVRAPPATRSTSCVLALDRRAEDRRVVGSRWSRRIRARSKSRGTDAGWPASAAPVSRFDVGQISSAMPRVGEH